MQNEAHLKTRLETKPLPKFVFGVCISVSLPGGSNTFLRIMCAPHLVSAQTDE
jgi:hypothetical protein